MITKLNLGNKYVYQLLQGNLKKLVSVFVYLPWS